MCNKLKFRFFLERLSEKYKGKNSDLRTATETDPKSSPFDQQPWQPRREIIKRSEIRSLYPHRSAKIPSYELFGEVIIQIIFKRGIQEISLISSFSGILNNAGFLNFFKVPVYCTLIHIMFLCEIHIRDARIFHNS